MKELVGLFVVKAMEWTTNEGNGVNDGNPLNEIWIDLHEITWNHISDYLIQ